MGLDAGSVFATLGGDFNPAGFAEFDAAMKRSAATAEAFEAKLASATKGMGSLGPAAGGASRGVSDLEKANKRASATLDSLGHAAKITAAGGLLAVVAATGLAVKQAADFERSMRNVNSIAKLSDTQFKRLSKSVLDLSGKTAQTPKQLADGLYDLVSSGIKAKDSIGVLKAAAVAASAGLTDTKTAIIPLVGALNAYHLQASDAAKVSDILFQTVNRGVVHFTDLASGLGPVLPLANSLKIPLRDVGAAISTLTKEGIPAADAFTYLANGMKVFLAPHKTLQAAIEKTGFATGDALVKAKGFQGALLAVAHTTDGTKGELAKLFPDIRALKDVLALTGTNASHAADDIRNFTDASTKGATAKVFAEQAKSASFQFQQLKADLSAVAIEVGTVLLPMLDRLAGGAQRALAAFIVSGGAKNLGNDLSAGFRELGQVISDLVPIARSAAIALGGISHALDLGNATHLEAIIAGFAGFKVAGVVAPMVARLVTQVRLLGTAPTAAAIGPDILAMINPFTAAALAAGGLVAALVLLGGQDSTETRLAKENAQAHKEQASAIKSVAEAERAAADKGLAAKQSTLDYKDAQQSLNDARDKFGKSSPQYKRALLDEEQAALSAKSAHDAYNRSLNEQHAKNETLVKDALKRLSTAKTEASALGTSPTHELSSAAAQAAGLPGTTAKLSPQILRQQAEAQANLNARITDYIQAVARSQVSDISRQRLMAESTQIQQKNALGIRDLAVALDGVPTKTQASILLHGDQDALARVGKLIATVHSVPLQREIKAYLTGNQPVEVKLRAITALIDGVPKNTVANILATTNGQQSVDALAAAIARVQSKQVTVAVNTISTQIQRITSFGQRAAGRAPGHGEMALVGEGRAPEDIYDPATRQHIVVDRPTLMALPQSAYVIPRDKQYAGRAAGLMAQLARQMGWGAFATGTAGRGTAHVPKWVDRKIPSKLDPLRFPVDDIDKARSKALKAYDDAKAYVHDEPDKIKALQTRQTDLTHTKVKGGEAIRKKNEHLKILNGQIAAARKKLSHERSELPKLRKAYQDRDTQLRDAKEYQAKIDKLVTKVEVDRNNMDLANKRHDAKGYDKAKTQRLADLKALRKLYADAQAHVPKDSQYWLDLQKQIGGTDNDLQDTGTETSDDQSTDASDLASTGMTKAERDQYAQIQADEALAALTPDNADDISATTREVALLTQVLQEVRSDPSRGGNAMVAQIATSLKTAQNNLQGLTSDVTPDAQAQIDQANARADAAVAERTAANDALAAFSSSGDIGTGGFANAGRAAQAGPQITIQTLHPGDSRTLSAIAQASAAGFAQQNPRPTPRLQTGI